MTDESLDSGNGSIERERNDLRTVADVDGTFHLRKWDTYSEDSETMTMWCDEEVPHEELEAFTFPIQVLDREGLCLECNYEKRKSSRERFREMRNSE